MNMTDQKFLTYVMLLSYIQELDLSKCESMIDSHHMLRI